MEEARQALEYRAFISESVLSAPRLAGISADAFQTQYSLMTEQQLFNFIKAGEADKAHALITKIFEENVQVCTNRSSENLKCLSYDIYSTLLKAAGELQVLYREDPDIDLLKRILCCTEYTRLFEEIDAAAGRLCRFSSEHTQSADTIYKEVARYIEQNFTNPNLNIGMLSETFRLSASYLSRLFKEGTGMGPLDYISIRRIEKAKMLLHDETLSAQAISGLSGFNEYHTFSRVFKKMEGISPQKYRELHHT